MFHITKSSNIYISITIKVIWEKEYTIIIRKSKKILL
jgi:hypothetical protein